MRAGRRWEGWRAPADAGQFSEWFRVKREGPFAVGRRVGGPIADPGYEHIRMEVEVKASEPERYFSFTWHPYAIDPAVDDSQEAPTLVEFRLEAARGGKRLTVKGSGFDRIPAARWAEAFRMNEGGWAGQMKNIEACVRESAYRQQGEGGGVCGSGGTRRGGCCCRSYARGGATRLPS